MTTAVNVLGTPTVIYQLRRTPSEVGDWLLSIAQGGSIEEAVHAALRGILTNALVGVPADGETGIDVANIQRVREYTSPTYTATVSLTLTDETPRDALNSRRTIEPRIEAVAGVYLGHRLMIFTASSHRMLYDDEGRFDGILDEYDLTYQEV